MQLEAGTIVQGKVSGITPFGAFITLEGNKTGLVHISEIALEYVKDINDHLKMGDAVTVKILSVDEKGKISLSIKQAILEERKKNRAPKAQRPSRPAEVDWSRKSNAPASFEDMMNSFKKSSDERMQDLKRNVESKRGSSYRRSSGSY